MRRLIRIAFVLTVATPVAAHAQRLLTVDLGGGVSLPQGNFRDGANTGWNALLAVGLRTPMIPHGLRLDVAHNQFDDKGPPARGRLAVTSGTLNLTYRLPSANQPIAPYVITGLGAYRTECVGATTPCDGDTRFGWNAGLGLRMFTFGIRSFIDARFQSVVRDGPNLNYFPITVGITL
jgi:hypothetical protein